MASSSEANTPTSTQPSAPESVEMTPSSTAENSHPTEANSHHSSPSLLRISCPALNASYGHRIQCFLMNYVQGPLDSQLLCPRGFFLPDRVTEELIYHKTIPKSLSAVYQYGLSTLENLKDVEISIYVYKEASATHLGRTHYRIDALAVCFDDNGWMIIGPQEDLCRGFLSIEWCNDNFSYTMDWDTMEFGEVLRLLRRTAKRNFDPHGALRGEEERVKIDETLGAVFPARGGNLPPMAPSMLHKFDKIKNESTDPSTPEAN